MWKCTWAIAWCAPLPLFSRTLYSLTPVAATTARHSRGSTRPSAAADSSDRLIQGLGGLFGNDQHVSLAKRRDVEECQHLVVLVDLMTGDLAANDLAEHRVCHG